MAINFNSMQNWGVNPNQSLVGQDMVDPMQPASTTPSMDTGIFSRQGMFGSAGWVNPVMSAAGAGVQLWQGMQQMDLAKEQLAFQKEAFAKNWQNQVQLTNTRMRDRQNARSSANPYAYQTANEYMANNEVK